MFERRLKFLGIVLGALTVLLLGRLMQVQVLGRAHYSDQARDVMTDRRVIPTTRGPILDVRGRVIAEDTACIDAAVDFRAVTRDTAQPYVQAWVRKLALQRLRERRDGAWSAPGANRKALLTQEMDAVRAEIDAMWHTLARLSDQSGDDIDDVRTRIEQEVRKKRRSITYRRYKSAVDEAASQPKPAWYQRWLTGGGDDLPTEDEFDDELIYEQQSPHVVLRAISPGVQNDLGRQLDRLPGLVLVPSTHRVYPYGHNAAHVIGYLGRVQADDLLSDPEAQNDLREYRPNDFTGRSGIEALAERRLRGTRGEEKVIGGADWGNATQTPPVPGQAVVSTLDIELQAQIRDMFTRVRIPHPSRDHKGEFETAEMHGAAVVIDIPTGEVRALVSYPDYDLNHFSELYNAMRLDEGNKPLMHRATMSQLEPGSTVKPMVGLAALAERLASIDDRIECDGFLHLRGRKWDSGRCWTATVNKPMVYVHHSIPVPHRGPTPDLDGHLNLQEAIERSCNVYFENMAERLGGNRLADWFERFGIGRYSGIGIAEARGTTPRDLTGVSARFGLWISGIGQGEVLATPLQVCNGIATIARGGIWVKPTIVRRVDNLTPWQPRVGPGEPPVNMSVPDRIDLHLPPEALAAAKRGMIAVVSSEAGSGDALRRSDLLIAAKTGTAQAEKFRPYQLDGDGKPMVDETGRRIRLTPSPGVWGKPNRDYPWYRASDSAGTMLHHAWMVGFAPADNPTVAFAVMIEYGGAGGGAVAGPIAKDLLEACIEHGYIPLRK